MGRKIFVSYKYADNQVENLPGANNSEVRHYVTEFEKILGNTDNIYKGESDGEDLSAFSEEYIWGKLRERIYDSSITIIFISPGMKDNAKEDKDQWIPWEVSYSLKETSRQNKNKDPITSQTNAMLTVVLPNTKGEYSYYLEPQTCCTSNCTGHHTTKLFKIIQNNKFNLKNANKRVCSAVSTVWSGDCSYISAVKWCDFKNNYNQYIDLAYIRRDNIDNYDIQKTI